ncbi:PREDICTED: uncharacterized protein LOC108362042 [Rhagoletis zephyria]|uniref:uncharacterized protein LOC108362042 n=1 Tax=Rhagoletis zephyria TaxID=28612 RepID=UPI00081169BE|nr:PREDICTED: uncharacterized protein LOC108362042 [Rhagoletis zephyria]
MRNCYRRELSKIKKSTRCGAGGDDIYKLTLWYFYQLDFLRDQETQTPVISTLEENDFDNEVESQRTRKRKKSDNNSEFLEKAIQHLDQAKNSNRERDDADVFAESWAILFRKLSAEQQIYAKRGIEEILVHGQLGNLHMNSVQITVSQRNPRTYTISRASTPCSSSSIPDPFPTVYTQAPQLLISRRTMPRNEYSQSGFAESPEFIHSNNSGSAQSFDELFSDAQYQ